ncbi:MAG: hypothetical protein PVI41_05015 [Roseobacter sp.]|jgi:hypothetical protein
MFADALSSFWPAPAREDTAPEPRARRASPVFIGDAVRPWGQDTMLLHILRRDAPDEGEAGQP